MYIAPTAQQHGAFSQTNVLSAQDSVIIQRKKMLVKVILGIVFAFLFLIIFTIYLFLFKENEEESCIGIWDTEQKSCQSYEDHCMDMRGEYSLYDYERNSCDCQDGYKYTKKANTCVRDCRSLGEHATLLPDSTCGCKEGYEIFEGVCIHHAKACMARRGIPSFNTSTQKYDCKMPTIISATSTTYTN